MLRKMLLATIMLAPIGALMAAGATPASAQTRGGSTLTACPGGIVITQLKFAPPRVAPGHSSTAHLTVRNCTELSAQASSTWVAKFTGNTTGCPVLDPLSMAITLPPRSTEHYKAGYEAPDGCDASALQLTVRISSSGGVIAQRTADLRIVQPTPRS